MSSFHLFALILLALIGTGCDDDISLPTLPDFGDPLLYSNPGEIRFERKPDGDVIMMDAHSSAGLFIMESSTVDLTSDAFYTLREYRQGEWLEWALPGDSEPCCLLALREGEALLGNKAGDLWGLMTAGWEMELQAGAPLLQLLRGADDEIWALTGDCRVLLRVAGDRSEGEWSEIDAPLPGETVTACFLGSDGEGRLLLGASRLRQDSEFPQMLFYLMRWDGSAWSRLNCDGFPYFFEYCCGVGSDFFLLVDEHGGFTRCYAGELAATSGPPQGEFYPLGCWSGDGRGFVLGNSYAPNASGGCLINWRNGAWVSWNFWAYNFSGAAREGFVFVGGSEGYVRRTVVGSNMWVTLRHSEFSDLATIAGRDGVYWASGGWSQLLRRAEGDEIWSIVNPPTEYSPYMSDMVIDAQGVPMALAFYHGDGVYHWRGDDWDFEVLPVDGGDYDVIWLDGEDRVCCAGRNGTVLRRDEEGWQAVNTGYDCYPKDAASHGERSIIACHGGVYMEGHGDYWTQHALPFAHVIEKVAFDPDGVLYLAGSPGFLWRETDGGQLIYQDDADDPTALHINSRGELWLSTCENVLVYWNGLSPSPKLLQLTSRILYDIVGNQDGSVRLVGENGVIIAIESAF